VDMACLYGTLYGVSTASIFISPRIHKGIHTGKKHLLLGIHTGDGVMMAGYSV
jgi:hypothetical protein